MAWLIPAQVSDVELIDARVVNTFEARLKKPFTPFYIGDPRYPFPGTAGDGALDQ